MEVPKFIIFLTFFCIQVALLIVPADCAALTSAQAALRDNSLLNNRKFHQGGSIQFSKRETVTPKKNIFFATGLEEDDHDHDDHDDHDHDEHDDHDSDSAEAWGFSILATVIISLFSFSAILLFIFNSSVVKKVTLPLLSLSAGTLLSSACFDLLKEAAEILGFGLSTAGLLFAGISFGIVLESVFKYLHISHSNHFTGIVGKDGQQSSDEKELKLMEKPEEVIIGEVSPDKDAESTTVPVEDKNINSEAQNFEQEHSRSNSSSHEYFAKVEKFESHVALNNLIADGFHNFIDGVLIGATFSVSAGSGLRTSLSVIFHEIPQELGDYQILRQAGYSVKAALLANFASACFCILGAIVGVAAGTNAESFANHCLPFTAGMFIFLSLSEIIPTVQSGLKTLKQQLVFLLFFSLGMGIILILSTTLPESWSHSH